MPMIQLPTEFKEFLKLLNWHNVKYLLINGWAVGHYGYVRATGGIDIWVSSDLDNAINVVETLNDFGLVGELVNADLITTKGQIIRFGVPPLRIEILTEISGVEFADCYPDKGIKVIEGIEIPLISLKHLIQNKIASGRPKDLADVDELKELL